MNDDAKAVLGMMAGGMKLSFLMLKSRPSDRMQGALDALLEVGAITEEPYAQRGVAYEVTPEGKGFLSEEERKRFAFGGGSDMRISVPITDAAT